MNKYSFWYDVRRNPLILPLVWIGLPILIVYSLCAMIVLVVMDLLGSKWAGKKIEKECARMENRC